MTNHLKLQKNLIKFENKDVFPLHSTEDIIHFVRHYEPESMNCTSILFMNDKETPMAFFSYEVSSEFTYSKFWAFDLFNDIKDFKNLLQFSKIVILRRLKTDNSVFEITNEDNQCCKIHQFLSRSLKAETIEIISKGNESIVLQDKKGLKQS